ncbi:phosphoribosyl-dephospho-CoA transferase [Pseudoduganella lurida]|uniref:Phosphoribosyl-dephospho-CoA transferase n=1 Tax=Pseudoduganella lurida TaxID=1036180 RepID=A0A562RJZ0_9BURK|nr:malonate decarboxylase holo-ACP synthase [Pseudoduganella lurida]TWI69375.1 phosphoribosyl-dephospho-CoA transferase [Pseudoduganella lurida]
MQPHAFRPHDLLFLRLPDRFDAGGAWPDWLDIAWLLRAPLVVRRDVASGSRVPVGARGITRSQRCKGHVQRAAVTRCVTPEMLAHVPVPPDCTLPPLLALAALAPQLDALGVAWGPAGGAGFQLASGLTALRQDSDLDLLVRAPSPLSGQVIDRLLALQQGASCRIDLQVDTGWGGFALAELARGGRVLLKTAHGPLLVADPWRHAEAA